MSTVFITELFVCIVQCSSIASLVIMSMQYVHYIDNDPQTRPSGDGANPSTTIGGATTSMYTKGSKCDTPPYMVSGILEGACSFSTDTDNAGNQVRFSGLERAVCLYH